MSCSCTDSKSQKFKYESQYVPYIQFFLQLPDAWSVIREPVAIGGKDRMPIMNLREGSSKIIHSASPILCLSTA
jgi:hypothetical protein